MAVVVLDRLTKTYKGATPAAVESVTLRIEDGEFFVLLGPSGCGKSTTLRMIAGLETISAGTLSIDGRTVNDVPAKDRDIAMVFQSYALYPHMTVADNLAFGLRRRGLPGSEIDRRVGRVADALGLGPYLGRKPHALSGGQRQRVALGRAIVREPKVFLFDEPLSNLDAALRVSTRNELVRLHRRLGATMIYVTHDQVEAMTMGTRICIMNRGRVVQVGAPMEVYDDPADAFVAGFLGSPPMNLLPASVEPLGAAPALRVGSEVLPLDARWGAVAPGPVTVGVRPEALGWDRDLAAPGLTAEVTALEPLGAETLVVLRPNGLDQDMTARAGRDLSLREGERVRLTADPRRVHLFDRASGLAIRPAPAPAIDLAASAEHRLRRTP